MTAVVNLVEDPVSHYNINKCVLTILVLATFIFHERLSNWHEASTTCLEEGGYLAVYNDKTESSISEILSNYSGSVWIGEYFTSWIWIKGLANF